MDGVVHLGAQELQQQVSHGDCSVAIDVAPAKHIRFFTKDCIDTELDNGSLGAMIPRLFMHRRFATGMVMLLMFALCSCYRGGHFTRSAVTREPVGPLDTNRYYTPVNQVLTPAGLHVELPGMRPQALALSPDGRLLVTSGKTPHLVVLDPETGRLLQRVPLPSEADGDPEPDEVSDHIFEPDQKGQLSFTGLVFSPDGSRIYLANVNGSIKVFGITPEHKVVGVVPYPVAADQCLETGRRYSLRPGVVAGWPTALCRAQFVQPLG